MSIKSLGLFLMCTIGALGCTDKVAPAPVPQQLLAHVSAHNPSDFARADELVYLPLTQLGVTQDKLSAWHNQSELPSQVVDRDGDGAMDHLAVMLVFAAAEKIEFEVREQASALKLTERTHAEISIKQGGEWQGQHYLGGQFVNVNELVAPPEHTDHSEFIRYEGPGIESDKVGYRIYLDWRNGFDIFGKTKQALALQNVGQDGFESYHHMADWGQDILKVGESLGIGGFGYWADGKVQRVEKTASRGARIVADGPLFSSFAIDYGQWQVDGKTSDVRALFSMNAGSRLVSVQLRAEPVLEPLVIGLGKLPETELLLGSRDLTAQAFTFVGTWGKQSLAEDDLGMALLFKRGDRDAQTEDAHNWVSVMAAPGGTLEYYFLAAWSGEPEGIKTRDQFNAYLLQETERLTKPVRLTIRSTLSDELSSSVKTADDVLALTIKMADTELRTKALGYRFGGWDVERDRPPRWEYTTGLLMQAFDDLSQASGEKRFAAAGQDVIGSFVTPEGDLRAYELDQFNIDNINSGNMLLRLHQSTGEERYRIAADKLRLQLKDHPKTSNGAFWHKQKYTSQVWLDGVYMGMPFLAGYTAAYEDGASLAEVVHEFKVTQSVMRLPSGLYRHAWDEQKVQGWAEPETGLSRYHWSRGMGWLAMALVDVIEKLPADAKEEREFMQAMLLDLANTLVKYQDAETGTWYQITDMPQATGNYLESSASAMFVYALAKGVNMGVLPDSFKASALAGYHGVLSQFVTQDPDGDVHLNNICLVAGLGFGRDGSYEYYMSEPIASDDPKGLAPFIMASVQINELLKR